MRAVERQLCTVCGLKLRTKLEMNAHVSARHGKNFPPSDLKRSKDQREFVPCRNNTPWGREFR